MLFQQKKSGGTLVATRGVIIYELNGIEDYYCVQPVGRLFVRLFLDYPYIAI